MSICAWCKKIKNNEGSWQKIEANLKKNAIQGFTHCICNDCAKKEYPELYPDINTAKTDG